MNSIPLRIVIFVITVGSLAVPLKGRDSVQWMDDYKNLIVWPVGKESVRLGIGVPLPDFAWVTAPRVVVIAAKNILAGKPQSWKVNKIGNFAHKGIKVVLLEDRHNHYLICLVENGRWIRLNDKRGLPVINILLGKDLGIKPNFSDVGKVINYVEDVAFFYKGPQRIVLSKAFRKVVDPDWGVWLEGKEKDFKQLRRLCSNPIITQRGTNVQIKCNIISDQGTVETWSLNGEQLNGIEINSLTVETIKEAGTFSFGFVN